MSIRKNIFSAFLFILSLTFISFGTSIYYLIQLGTVATETLQENCQSVIAAEELIISLAKIDRALVMLCLDDDLEQDEKVLLKVVNSEKKIALGYLNTLEKILLDPEDRPQFNKLKEVYEQYDTNLQRIATSRDRTNLYLGGLRWQSEVLRFSSTKVVQRHRELLETQEEALQQLYSKAKINTFLAAIFVLLVVITALDKLPSWIIRPIVELTEKVKKLARGYADETVPVIQVTASSELADLADSIHTTNQKLRESEEKLWLITKNLYDIILFCTPDKKIFYTTPSIWEVLGYAPEEAMGQLPTDFIHPDDRYLSAKPGADKMPYSEMRVRKKYGHYLWMEISYTTQRDKESRIVYIQYTARDIGYRKQVEEEIKRGLTVEKALNEKLTQANQELDQLVYSASHNLRAPLTSVLGLVSLLKLHPRKQERQKLLDLTEKSIHQLDETIRDITDYSRNERSQVKVEALCFEALVVDTIRSLQLIQPAQGLVDIRYHIDPATRCYSDPERLKTIFINLGSNAIKYHNANHPTPRLLITIAPDRETTLITFTDNGVGIVPALQSHVFDMFYRANEQADGAGLGLYIAKNMVAKLEGTITLDSVLGEGTTVTLRLPSLKKTKSCSAKRLKQDQLS